MSPPVIEVWDCISRRVVMKTGKLAPPHKRVWAKFYKPRSLSRIPTKSQIRIAEAETVLVIRARDLFGSAGDNIEQEQAVDDAMYALHALRSALKCRANAKNTSEELAA